MKQQLIQLTQENLAEINKLLEQGYSMGQQIHVPGPAGVTVYVTVTKGYEQKLKTHKGKGSI